MLQWAGLVPAPPGRSFETPRSRCPQDEARLWPDHDDTNCGKRSDQLWPKVAILWARIPFPSHARPAIPRPMTAHSIENIRNFGLIAHMYHGKFTLLDLLT